MNERTRRLFWPLLILVLVLVFNLIFTPGFFSIEMRDGQLYGSLIDIFNRAAPVLLLALGMTLVISTGGVDLSVGAVMAISGATAACLIARPEGSILSGLNLGGSVALVVGVALLAALICGLFNGILISFFRLQPIVATLLLMVAGRGLAQLLTNGQIVIFSEPGFAAIGRGEFLALPNPIWLFVGTLIFFWLLTRKTAFGLFVEAVGSNPSASSQSGVNERAVKLAVYALAGLCAGLAGLIGTADLQAADANNTGLYLELDAILAVAVGGTAMAGGRFSLAGSVIGALMMQAITTTIFTRGVPPETALILKALVVVGVVLAQSPNVRGWRRRQQAAGSPA